MKDKSDWAMDIIKYSFLWMLGLGIAVVFVTPLYIYLLETMGGWVYLGFILLGFLTKLYFVKIETHE